MPITYKNFEEARKKVEQKWKENNFEKLLAYKELFEELEESKRVMLKEFFENYKHLENKIENDKIYN